MQILISEYVLVFYAKNLGIVTSADMIKGIAVCKNDGPMTGALLQRDVEQEQ